MDGGAARTEREAHDRKQVRASEATAAPQSSAPGQGGGRVVTRGGPAWAAAAWIALAVGGAILTWWVIDHYASSGWLMADAHAYWTAGRADGGLYTRPPGSLDAYLYSPVFAQVVGLVAWLPWPAFAVLWAVAESAAFLWLLRPLGWVRAGVLLLWCSPELALGNIYGWIAVASFLALSGRPQWWALPALTKPTLAVGLLWHMARREWRAAATAVATILAVVAASLAVDPAAWREWLGFIVASGQEADLLLVARIVAASAVILFAALSGQAWLVPFGLMTALPIVNSVSVMTILAAVPRLRRAPQADEVR